MWLQESKGTSKGRDRGKGNGICEGKGNINKGICENKGNIKLKLPLHMPWKHNGVADRALHTFQTLDIHGGEQIKEEKSKQIQ